MNARRTRPRTGRTVAQEFRNDELQLFAVGLLRAAVRKLLFARSPGAEAAAWAALKSDLGQQFIESLGCDSKDILHGIESRVARLKSRGGYA